MKKNHEEENKEATSKVTETIKIPARGSDETDFDSAKSSGKPHVPGNFFFLWHMNSRCACKKPSHVPSLQFEFYNRS